LDLLCSLFKIRFKEIKNLKFYKPVYIDVKHLSKVEVVNIDGEKIYFDTIIT
jgi:hypothetical protein